MTSSTTSHDLLNPIEFLHLEALSTPQKRNLVAPLLADISAYVINSLAATLNPVSQNQFLDDLEKIAHDPVAITKLVATTFPDLESRRVEILNEYRQTFKLQKFISYLSVS